MTSTLEGIKNIYDNIDDDARNSLRSKYPITVKDKLNEWKIKLENNLITQDELHELKQAILGKELAYLNTTITNGNDPLKNERLAQRIILFFDYIQFLNDVELMNPNREVDLLFQTLNVKQVQKIGLLIRSGIIAFLKKENPNISNNQIAGFIALLTKEQLKQTSINPHLSETNSKYAIQNEQDKADLDLILNQYGISPKSN